MDNEDMATYLIEGGMIKILEAGTCSLSTAHVTRDDRTRSGFRVIFHAVDMDEAIEWGQQITPRNATDGIGIVESEKEVVELYLIESFGLNKVQALRVVNEARWLPLAA